MIRPLSYRATSLALAVLILGCAPGPIQDPPATPAAAHASSNVPVVLQPAAYLPMVVNNFDPTYINPFGVIMYGGVNDLAGLLQMQAAGSRWATARLSWAGVEPNPPIAGVHSYIWDGFDTQAHNAQAAGLSLFVLFTGNPAWAAHYPGGPVTDMPSLVAFVTAMAERYDGDGIDDAPGNPIINDWSFYAEPDNGEEARALGGKGWWGNNPAGYAALLSQISPAIHAANPNAKVLIGGLAYDWFTTEGGPFVQSFLGNVLAALNAYPGGITHYLDALAFHFYPIRTQRWPTVREKTLEIKGILNAHGAGALPLMVPEMGYWSGTSQGSTETNQAQTLVQMYARGLSVGIQEMSWYQVFDTGAETMGLFRNRNLSDPKPSYTAYGVMTAQLAQFHYTRDFTAPGVEGYVFRRLSGETKTVLWAKTGSPTAAFAQSCVRRVDLLGGEDRVADGSSSDADHAINGTVTLALGVNAPVYVGTCS